VTLYRNRTGWKQRIGIVRILIAPDQRHLGLGTAMIREIRHLGEKVALNYLMAEVIEEQEAAVRALRADGLREDGGLSEFRQRPERAPPQSRGASPPDVGS